MSTSTPTDNDPRSRWLIYTAAGLIFLILLAITIPLYHGHKESKDATAKAQQVSDAVVAAGYPAPDVDMLAGVLGTDGGAVCAAPTGSLSKAILKAQIANGATGPGMRRVITAKEALAGEGLIIKIYCPDKTDEFKALVATFKFGDVIKR